MIYVLTEAYPHKLYTMTRVRNLDIHKDSIFVCNTEAKQLFFQEKFGLLTSK